MSATATPVEPADFPWYDYHGFTFSLGLQIGGHVVCSGHSGSAFDPAKGKPDVAGGMADQARVAYAKQAAVLEAAGRSMADVTRVVENVTLEGLAHYPLAEQVRQEVFGAHRPVVVTVAVDRLVRRKALIEVSVEASPGGGSALVTDADEGWRRGTVREGHDQSVLLPTLLPVDEHGSVVHPADLAGQYEYCLDRAGELLTEAGLSPAHVVQVVDYLTPGAALDLAELDRVRREKLGPQAPAGATVVMSVLHEPGVLVAVELVASRHPARAVLPVSAAGAAGAQVPAVVAGRTLYLGGAGAAAVAPAGEGAGEVGGQARAAYEALLRTLAAAGCGPQDLLSTVEYVTPQALPAYREVADVRRELLREPYPASTGIVCHALARPGLLLEVVATALVPDRP